jgi:hypothetical protein
VTSGGGCSLNVGSYAAECFDNRSFFNTVNGQVCSCEMSHESVAKLRAAISMFLTAFTHAEQELNLRAATLREEPEAPA